MCSNLKADKEGRLAVRPNAMASTPSYSVVHHGVRGGEWDVNFHFDNVCSMSHRRQGSSGRSRIKNSSSARDVTWSPPCAPRRMIPGVPHLFAGPMASCLQHGKGYPLPARSLSNVIGIVR